MLEKSNLLEETVKNNKISVLRKFVNRLPNSLCVDLSIYSENDLTTPVMSVLRPGCKKNFFDSATFNRGFVIGSGLEADFYLARLSAWQRVEE